MFSVLMFQRIHPGLLRFANISSNIYFSCILVLFSAPTLETVLPVTKIIENYTGNGEN